MSCAVGQRRSSDPVLLWLWCRPAAIALIRPPAWESPYAVGAALEKKAKRKKKNTHTHIYVCVCVCVCVYTYVCMYHDQVGLTLEIKDYVLVEILFIYFITLTD